jgi:propanol-preferring alcohol dehydrogenase
MTRTALAMVMEALHKDLHLQEVSTPEPAPGQVLVQVRACAVCRTDLHILDGDLPGATIPRILGHQIVGVISGMGDEVSGLRLGQRVGIPWIGWACGRCRYCTTGRENLCPDARFTGFDIDGGYAQTTVADAGFCLPLPDGYPDAHAAPLLCAGLIGWRCLKMAGDAERLGIYGFGSAARLVAQVARHEGRRIFAFTRPGDEPAQSAALELGAVWAGGSDQAPPEELDGAIVFAAVGSLVPTALGALAPGGTVVCGEIHMTDIPSFPYELLWKERVVRSVANLTRDDGIEFLEIARRFPVRTEITEFPLAEANEAIGALRDGRIHGAAVLIPPSE